MQEEEEVQYGEEVYSACRVGKDKNIPGYTGEK